MNVPQSKSDGDSQCCEEKWDESQLQAAYNKALKLVDVDVAKRIAMSTNSKQEGKNDVQSPKQSNKKVKWSPGMSCRAVYEEDGLEYEAFVVQILNDKECIVKFFGYGNSDRVDINTLKPSQGEEVLQQQIEMAMIEKGEESDASGTSDDEERAQSPESTERLYNKTDSRKNKWNPQSMNCFQLPEELMPNLDKLRNSRKRATLQSKFNTEILTVGSVNGDEPSAFEVMASMDIPMPPPLPFGVNGVQCEEQAVSSMLVSWYMSGYYTGLYQGIKRFKPNKRQKD